MIVGIIADFTNPTGETPFSKYFDRIDWPAGFGALAITVKPPPVTAPATTAYLSSSVNPGTSVLRKVIA